MLLDFYLTDRGFAQAVMLSKERKIAMSRLNNLSLLGSLPWSNSNEGVAGFMCGFRSGLWTAAQLHYSLLSPKRDASSIPLESLSTPFIVCPPHSTRRVFDMRSKSSCYMTRLIIFCFARREQRPVSEGLSSLRRNRWPSRPWMARWKMTLWSSHMYVGWTCLMAASGCNELF